MLRSGEITASICYGLRKRSVNHDRKCASANSNLMLIKGSYARQIITLKEK